MRNGTCISGRRKGCGAVFHGVKRPDWKVGTYDWLKNNKELINVATSRAKDKLDPSCGRERIGAPSCREMQDDDLYELVQYVKTNGEVKNYGKTYQFESTWNPAVFHGNRSGIYRKT